MPLTRNKNNNSAVSTGTRARQAPTKKKKAVANTDVKSLQKTLDDSLPALLAKAKKGMMPKNIKPMFATLVNAPFDDPDWVYEVKWDGYRALGFVKKGKGELLSRNNKSFDKKILSNTRYADHLEGRHVDRRRNCGA